MQWPLLCYFNLFCPPSPTYTHADTHMHTQRLPILDRSASVKSLETTGLRYFVRLEHAIPGKMLCTSLLWRMHVHGSEGARTLWWFQVEQHPGTESVEMPLSLQMINPVPHYFDLSGAARVKIVIIKEAPHAFVHLHWNNNCTGFNVYAPHKTTQQCFTN